MFSRRKGKDGKSKKKGANQELDQQPAKPRWTDAWARTSVEPEEVHELVKRCTEEIKSRGMPPISHLEKQSIPHALYSPNSPHLGLRQCSLQTLVQPHRVPQKLISFSAQLSINLSCYCPSDRRPIPARCGHLYATSSTTMRFAARPWRRSYGWLSQWYVI